MKKYLVLLLTAALLAGLLTGCKTELPLPTGEPTEPSEENTNQVMPRNVIQIGDSFEYSPMGSMGTGHWSCTVTDVRLVENASDCPYNQKMVEDVSFWCYPEGDEYGRMYDYDEWFTEGGAFDLGARWVLVDLTVTNVDAVVTKLFNGTFVDTGFFSDPYVFYAHDVFQLVDMTVVKGWGGDEYFEGPSSEYFSRWGELTEDPVTPGVEAAAIRLLPGETISYTLGYQLHGEKGGKMADLSKNWLYIKHTGEVFGHVETGIFIDTKLDERYGSAP